MNRMGPRIGSNVLGRALIGFSLFFALSAQAESASPRSSWLTRGLPYLADVEASPGFDRAASARWEALEASGLTMLVPSYRADRCPDVYVYIVMSGPHGVGGTATVSVGGEAGGSVVSVGARVGPYLAIAIGNNPVHLGPAVWLAKGDWVCQALLRDPSPKRHAAVVRERQRNVSKLAQRRRASPRKKPRSQRKSKSGRARTTTRR